MAILDGITGYYPAIAHGVGYDDPQLLFCKQSDTRGGESRHRQARAAVFALSASGDGLGGLWTCFYAGRMINHDEGIHGPGLSNGCHPLFLYVLDVRNC